MEKLRIAVIGAGGMGCSHINNLATLERAEVTAVCDQNPKQVGQVAERFHCQGFTDYRTLLDGKICDAVLIATPHYAHTTVGIDALSAGLHVLVEKPISVHKADCEKLIAAHRSKKQVFAAMFQMRTKGIYRKVKQLIDSGELGDLVRVNWIITTWFRTEAYYASGSWRATWEGEGGGVLLNQCPHQLDLLQWLCGMPKKVRAFCGFGKYHRIEVEDEVTAYLDYENGATGVFVTSTGEHPGTDRLEICGEQGKLVVEKGQLHYSRNEVPTTRFSRKTKVAWSAPDVWECDIPISAADGNHRTILANFIDAVLDGAPLIAPAAEGIHSVELANAMLMSAVTDTTVELPLDAAAFERQLQRLIRESRRSGQGKAKGPAAAKKTQKTARAGRKRA